MICSYCGTDNQANSKYCSNCGKELVCEIIPEERSKKTFGLGWHKFMIYFSLFAGAILNLSQGVQLIAGVQYGDLAEQVYNYYRGLKSVDVLYGCSLIVVAAFFVYTRFRLAAFKRGAPKLLTILYSCTILLTLLYLALVDSITGISMMDTSVISSIVGSVTMAVINVLYYKRRANLFVQ